MRLVRLADEASAGHAAARGFCLAAIKEVYGFDHRPDWHADLDSLLLPPCANHYSRANAGAFWMLHDAAGAPVATAGIRHLGWKPDIARIFAGRYQDARQVASLCRVYVRRDRRRQGLGRWLAALGEAAAGRLGYRTMYLHASSDTPAALAFWTAMGYAFIGAGDDSSHFDRPIVRSDDRTEMAMTTTADRD